MRTGWGPNRRQLTEIRARAVAREPVEAIAELLGVACEDLRRHCETKHLFPSIGRPRKLFSDWERSFVQAASAMGMPQHEIARTLNVDSIVDPCLRSGFLESG